MPFVYNMANAKNNLTDLQLQQLLDNDNIEKDHNFKSPKCIRYKKDKWNPMNTGGKKCYDSDFLICLGKLPKSRNRPDNLPDLEIVLKEGNRIDNLLKILEPKLAITVFNKDSKTPKDQKGLKLWEENLKLREDNMKSREDSINLREQYLTLREKSVLSREKSLLLREKLLTKREEFINSHTEYFKLQDKSSNLQMEHSAKSTRFFLNKMFCKPETSDDEVCKRVEQILKKLTSINCNILVEQIKPLILKNLDCMQRILDKIFDRVTLQSADPFVYAFLCKELVELKMDPDTSNKKGECYIKNLLLAKCETEFKNISNCNQTAKSEHLKKDANENLVNFTKFIKFAGELYKNQIIPHTVMLHYLRILKYHDEVNLECLSILLNIIGREMEINNNQSLQTVFDMIIEQVNANCDKISHKIRLMLRDLINLRNPDYEPWRHELDSKIVQRILKYIYLDQSSVLKEPISFLCLSRGTSIKLIDAQDHELRLKIKTILKELPNGNVDKCVNEIKAFGFEEPGHLTNIVNAIHEKAMEDPDYIASLAILCKELATIQNCKIIKDVYVYGSADFRQMLIDKCQYEFHKSIIKLKPCDHITEKNIDCSFKNYVNIIKIYALRNIAFVGELFKKQLVQDYNIIGLLSFLCDNSTEENLDCLCVLLAIVGKCTEINHRQNLQSYFDIMQIIIDMQDTKYSTEIRNKLQDVIHLRNPKWVEKWKNIPVRAVAPAMPVIRPAQVHNIPSVDYRSPYGYSYMVHKVTPGTSYTVQQIPYGTCVTEPTYLNVNTALFPQPIQPLVRTPTNPYPVFQIQSAAYNLQLGAQKTNK